ncbi:SMR family transporter [Dehalobacter sp. DCM]|uniref:SMR family transporter n=1 Tax=Dehalobacter sp. DCM TaxID=2907827 RepID=UPI003081359F|nr:SMR family transporter [Dehalobacter sp. DCM]
MIYLLALISIALGSVGQFGLKLASEELETGSGIWNLILTAINTKMVLSISCFVISMVLWIFVLRKLELSIAYPMVSMGYIFVMLLSFFFLQEQIDIQKLIGTGLIVSGVVVLNVL